MSPGQTTPEAGPASETESTIAPPRSFAARTRLDGSIQPIAVQAPALTTLPCPRATPTEIRRLPSRERSTWPHETGSNVALGASSRTSATSAYHVSPTGAAGTHGPVAVRAQSRRVDALLATGATARHDLAPPPA